MNLAEPVLPQHDPCFQSTVVLDLLQHFRQWRKVGRLYAAELPSHERAQLVGKVVERARRLGFVIEGDRRRGYMLTDFVMPLRVYYVRPGLHSGRMAECADEGQRRGEIATQKDGAAIRDLVTPRDKVPATLSDLGIPPASEA